MSMSKPLRALAILFFLPFPSGAEDPEPTLEAANARSLWEFVKPVLQPVTQEANLSENGKLSAANENAGPREEITTLMKAASEGDLAAVRHLLEQGANVNAKDEDGWTPLFFAAFSGRTEVVRLLIDKRADINQVDRIGQTPLMTAAARGQTNTVCALVESGIEINAADKDGRTALMYAADLGHRDTVRALLERGANSAARNAKGATALQLAQKNKYREIVALLSSQAMQGTRPRDKMVDTPDAAIVLAKYLSAGLQAPLSSPTGNPARLGAGLPSAAEPRSAPEGQHLFKERESTRASGNYGYTALMNRSRVDQTSTEPALLEKEAGAKDSSVGTAEVHLRQDRQPAGQGGATIRTAPQLVVRYIDGELTVKANNVPLSKVLKAICEEIDAEFEFTSGADEPIFVDIGPGPAKKVIASLLEGSPSNYAMTQSADDPNLVSRLAILLKATDSKTPSGAPQSLVAENRVAANQQGQPEGDSPQGAPAAKDTGVQQQIKEVLMQAKAEILNSGDSDPEVLSQVNAQIEAALAAAAANPSQFAPSPMDSPVVPIGRSRHRGRR
jgi:hypothetical protein